MAILKKMFHGTRQILNQLVFSAKAQQLLTFRIKALQNDSYSTLSFIQQFTTNHQISSTSNPSIVFIGRQRRGPISRLQSQLVVSYLGQQIDNSFSVSEQITKDHVYFRTEQADRTRCSSFCIYKDINGERRIGSIQNFVVDHSIAIIVKYDGSPYSPAQRLPRRPPIRQCIDLITRTLSQTTATEIRNLNSMTIIPIKDIICKCVVSQNVVFCIPNNYEHH